MAPQRDLHQAYENDETEFYHSSEPEGSLTLPSRESIMSITTMIVDFHTFEILVLVDRNHDPPQFRLPVTYPNCDITFNETETSWYLGAGKGWALTNTTNADDAEVTHYFAHHRPFVAADHEVADLNTGAAPREGWRSGRRVKDPKATLPALGDLPEGVDAMWITTEEGEEFRFAADREAVEEMMRRLRDPPANHGPLLFAGGEPLVAGEPDYLVNKKI